jgi:carbon starvation protein
MAGLALLLIALWLRSEGRKNAWALYPSIFMIVTDLAALIYIAYTNFFVKLPAAATGQAAAASILVGLITVVLVVAAAILIVDGWKALRKPRAEAAAEVA